MKRLIWNKETVYNDKYVYFTWNEKLENQKVVASNSTFELEKKVKEDGSFCTVQKSDSAEAAFISNGNSFFFVYFDPLLEYKKAYLKGELVQYQYKNYHWITITNFTCWDEGLNYRIIHKT